MKVKNFKVESVYRVNNGAGGSDYNVLHLVRLDMEYYVFTFDRDRIIKKVSKLVLDEITYLRGIDKYENRFVSYINEKKKLSFYEKPLILTVYLSFISLMNKINNIGEKMDSLINSLNSLTNENERFSYTPINDFYY